MLRHALLPVPSFTSARYSGAVKSARRMRCVRAMPDLRSTAFTCTKVSSRPASFTGTSAPFSVLTAGPSGPLYVPEVHELMPDGPPSPVNVAVTELVPSHRVRGVPRGPAAARPPASRASS